MAVEEGVRCPACGRSVVPRLWLKNERSVVMYRTSQHLCPYCGVVMYESGGGVNWPVVMFLLAVFAVCGLFLLAAFMLKR